MEKKDLRIIFMGTPEFAVESLRQLVEDGYNVVAVVTQPDKPVGRHGSVLHASAVKEYALSKGLPVLQPVKMKDPDFIEHHKEDIAASLEWTIVDILMKKLKMAVKQTGIKHVAVAGGVSANNGLRNAFKDHAKRYHWDIYIPKFSYTTDNAAMIAITGYYKYMDKEFCPIDAPAFSKVTFK